MPVRTSTVGFRELSKLKIRERPDVREVREQDSLNDRARTAYNVERVVMVRSGFVVREDQYDHAIVHEDVPRCDWGVSPSNQS
jgi:hypothetical protein